MYNSITIQIQFPDGCTACWRQADEIKMIGTPNKMHVPGVPSWMEEQSRSIRGGIEGMRFVVFGTVTPLTGQGKVVFRASAALTFREDMVDGMQLCGTEFRANAVFATAPRALPDEASQFDWNALLSHAAQV